MLRILKKAIVPDDECCFATDECNLVRCSACEANCMYDGLAIVRLSVVTLLPPTPQLQASSVVCEAEGAVVV
jgi:hypothetical protein